MPVSAMKLMRFAMSRSWVRSGNGRAARMRWLWVLTLAAAAMGSAEPVVAASGGEKRFKEIQEANGFYPDERWQRYVQDIGARILEHVPTRGQEFHFHVIDEASVNASAYAGGYTFYHRGLFAFLKSEDEVASVVAHEIAHVVAKHVSKRRTSQILGKSLGWLTASATGRTELWELANVGFAALGSGYGREHELEADRLGGEWMARAGYSPMAALDALQALKDEDSFYAEIRGGRPMGYHGLFVSHPKHDKRLHDILAQSQRLMPEAVREPVGDFWALVDGLAYGNEAARGLVRGNTYYHGGLRIALEFPKGWHIRYSPAQVKGTAPGGADEGSIGVTRQAPVKRKSPKQYVTDVLKRDDVIAGEELEINGQPAFIGDVDVGGSNVPLQLIGILYGRDIVTLFKGECGPKGDPEEFREAFRATMEGLRLMTVDDLKVANSQRIKVIVAEPGQTYADLARQSSLVDYAEQTLRLLNSAYPNGEPRAGDYIKIVE